MRFWQRLTRWARLRTLQATMNHEVEHLQVVEYWVRTLVTLETALTRCCAIDMAHTSCTRHAKPLQEHQAETGSEEREAEIAAVSRGAEYRESLCCLLLSAR